MKTNYRLESVGRSYLGFTKVVSEGVGRLQPTLVPTAAMLGFAQSRHPVRTHRGMAALVPLSVKESKV